jgi:hypothetical protein
LRAAACATACRSRSQSIGLVSFLLMKPAEQMGEYGNERNDADDDLDELDVER